MKLKVLLSILILLTGFRSFAGDNEPYSPEYLTVIGKLHGHYLALGKMLPKFSIPFLKVGREFLKPPSRKLNLGLDTKKLDGLVDLAVDLYATEFLPRHQGTMTEKDREAELGRVVDELYYRTISQDGKVIAVNLEKWSAEVKEALPLLKDAKADVKKAFHDRVSSWGDRAVDEIKKAQERILAKQPGVSERPTCNDNLSRVAASNPPIYVHR